MAGIGPDSTLQDETRQLRERLEEERKKLNDATFTGITSKVEPLQSLSLKTRKVLKGHRSKVLHLDWSLDRRRLVCSTQDGEVAVWDAFTQTKEVTFSLPCTWILACAYGPSGEVVACGGLDNKCSLFQVSAGSKKQVVAMHTNYVSSCAFAGSDQQLLTGSGDNTCALWDVETATLETTFHGHTAEVMSVAVSPSDCSHTFISGGFDGMLKLWDLRTGKMVQEFKGHTGDINSVRFFPSGDAVASGSDDATVRLFDLRADRQVAIYAKESVLFGCTSLDFSFSGRLIFAGYNDYTINIWDTLRGERVTQLFGHENRVSCVRTTPDGCGMASASWDTLIKVWA